MKDSKKDVSNALHAVESSLRDGLRDIYKALDDVEFIKNQRTEDLQLKLRPRMRRSEKYMAALLIAAFKSKRPIFSENGELNRGNFFAYLEGYIGATEPTLSLMAEGAEAYLEYNDPSALEKLDDKF